MESHKMLYNTDINIIGSIPNYQLILKTLKMYSKNSDKIEEMIIKNNEFDFRTERSRKRFLSGVESAFLSFKNEEYKKLIKNLFDTKLTSESENMILFWQLLINNKLFFDITKEVFLKEYYSGKVSFSKEYVIAFIKDLIFNNDDLKGKWGESTINTIASKYLTILKKLDLLEGSKIKKFKNIYLSDESFLIFLQIIKNIESSNINILKSIYINFSFISEENLLFRIKSFAKKGLLNMNFDGKILKIELLGDF
jgi:hypothetical protein